MDAKIFSSSILRSNSACVIFVFFVDCVFRKRFSFIPHHTCLLELFFGSSTSNSGNGASFSKSDVKLVDRFSLRHRRTDELLL